MLCAILDWTEDPIFIRVQDRERRALKKVCEFDSSQESVETTQVTESQNSTSITECNSILNHSSTNDAKLRPFVTNHQEDCIEHCLNERVSHTQQREVHDERPLPSCSESSQESQVSSSTYTCTSATNQGNNYSQESAKDCDTQTQTDIKLPLSTTECAVQTMNTITREISTQWSPVNLPSQPDTVATSTEMPPACSNHVSSEIATQTQSSSGLYGAQCCAIDDDRKNNVHVMSVDKHVWGATSTKDVEKMKEEIECLKRQLGVAQSTLVWQSLMTRLHQL